MTKNFTDLVGGKKVPKDDPRIELCGIIDEANSALGIARAITRNDMVSKIIYQIQQELFIIGAECATLPDMIDKMAKRITTDTIQRLERLTNEINKKMNHVESFVVPGESLSSATLHLARTIVRRAERFAVKLERKGQISENILIYLDKLSNLIFSLARFEAEHCL